MEDETKLLALWTAVGLSAYAALVWWLSSS